MIGKFSDKSLLAMATIARSEIGVAFIDGLRAQQRDIDKKLRHSNDDLTKQLQGAARTLETLVQKFEMADHNLAALKATEKR